MKKQVLVSFFLAGSFLFSSAQQATDVISVQEVQRIESFLAADDLRGRAVGTPGIQKAAEFIAAEFQKAGLQPLKGSSYLQEFVMLRPKLNEMKFKADNTDLKAENMVVITTQKDLSVTEKSGYAIEQVKAGESLSKVMQFARPKKNTIVLVDTSFAKNFNRLNSLRRDMFPTPYSTVFVLGTELPTSYKIKAEHSFEESRLANVVGVLPGRSRKNEQVIFSAHYDHIGVGKPVAGDSIYNGANDDAAGTTAVILLANHFKKMASNERTLVFAAFTAEESGMVGSQYFSEQFKPETVTAMFNIEMIGTESKWGRNSAFITGFEETNLGTILQSNLQGSAFTFHPDPYPQQQLFYRSDNATLARLGVPAHTISTAKMEDEPHYHKPSDEIGTLDMENMAQIIRAIAESSKSIISGKDTPTRVKAESLAR